MKQWNSAGWNSTERKGMPHEARLILDGLKKNPRITTFSFKDLLRYYPPARGYYLGK